MIKLISMFLSFHKHCSYSDGIDIRVSIESSSIRHLITKGYKNFLYHSKNENSFKKYHDINPFVNYISYQKCNLIFGCPKRICGLDQCSMNNFIYWTSLCTYSLYLIDILICLLHLSNYSSFKSLLSVINLSMKYYL